MSTRAGCVAAILALGCGAPPPPDTPTGRAVSWLAARQRDGLWASETYTVLGSGQALTPFVLYALSHAPPAELEPHRGAVDRALDALPLEGDEYPSYALALSILALRRLRPEADVAKLEARLRSLRLTEVRGWSPEDPPYGAWDYGTPPSRKPEGRRPDLSVTAMACEALGADDAAKRFARRCAVEGGFVFTPDPRWERLNKAGPGTAYASATWDAARILGTAPKTPPPPPPGEWGEALFFYEAYARAKVAPSRALGEAVAARQRPDGSFANPKGLMKEDDPLVATGLALIALSLCR